MLFKVGDKVTNPNQVPCAVFFRNELQIKKLIDKLQQMVDSPTKEYRTFAICPDDMDYNDFINWSNLLPEDQKILNITP